MKEFERALLEARPPDLQVEGFRQALRRDLIREKRRRERRRASLALGGLAVTSAALAAIVALFVLRPSVPRSLHRALLEDTAVQPAGLQDSGPGTPLPQAVRAEDLRELLVRTGATATADREWLDGLYELQLDSSRVKALEEERIFALRRFQLTSGRTIVVLSEIGGDPAGQPVPEISTSLDF